MTARRLVAELLGTAGLLLAIVGSGIALAADGPGPLQLAAHAIVVGITLAALIVTFGPVSGAHFNPAVTLGAWLLGSLRARDAGGYVAVQVAGGALGAVLANVLFSHPPVALATTERAGSALAGSEAVATFGLVVVILGLLRAGRAAAVPAAVGAWITGAIVFTPSTAFANPAVTVARTLTDTYTGIAPAGVPAFLAAQLVAACAAALLVRWLFVEQRVDAGGALHEAEETR